jgi:hypothetical protein
MQSNLLNQQTCDSDLIEKMFGTTYLQTWFLEIKHWSLMYVPKYHMVLKLSNFTDGCDAKWGQVSKVWLVKQFILWDRGFWTMLVCMRMQSTHFLNENFYRICDDCNATVFRHSDITSASERKKRKGSNPAVNGFQRKQEMLLKKIYLNCIFVCLILCFPPKPLETGILTCSTTEKWSQN